MSWWYVSSPSITGAVRVEDDLVVEAPPIFRKFIGQPAKNLGGWLRAQGDARSESDTRFERLREFTHIYNWGNNPKRETMKGRPCLILARGTAMRSVLIEFADGQKEIVSHRSLRSLG